MAKRPVENLVWNAQVRQMMLEGEDVISAFEQIAARDQSEAQRALDKLVGPSSHARTTEIPTWAITTLARAWKRYTAESGRLSLGKAFGLEGTRDGVQKTLPRDTVRRKTVDLAFEVQALIDQGISKTRAIRLVAELNDRTADQLTKALKSPTKVEIADRLRRLQARDGV